MYISTKDIVMDNEGGKRSYVSLFSFLIIILTVVLDFYWLDRDRKRWGWMNNWSNKNKALFFIGFIAVSSLIYLYFGLSIKHL